MWRERIFSEARGTASPGGSGGFGPRPPSPAGVPHPARRARRRRAARTKARNSLSQGAIPASTLLLAADGAQDCLLLYSYCTLLESGEPFGVAAPQAGMVVGEHGYAIVANLAFSQIDAGRYSRLVLPGPRVSDVVRADPRAAAIVSTFIEAGSVVAPICRGGRIGMSASWLGEEFAVVPAPASAGWRARRTGSQETAWRWEAQAVARRCPDGLPASSQAMFRAIQRCRNCPGVPQAPAKPSPTGCARG